MSKKRLLIIGKSYMEFVCKVKRAPERLERIISNQEHYIAPSGFGVISAVTASRLDIDTILCTRIGEDENGEKLSRVFKTENIDTRFVYTDKRKETGVISTVIEEGNKARAIIYPSANNNLCFDDIESSLITYPDAVMLCPDLPNDLSLDTVKFANGQGTPVVLTVSKDDRDFDFVQVGNIELFLCDRYIAHYLTGIDPVDADSALHASVKLAKIIKARNIIIRLGERGVFSYDGIYSEIYPRLPVDAVDSTGSETVFDAAASCAFVELGDVHKAADFANSALAYSTTVDGSFASIPTLDAINAIFEKHHN